MEKNIFYYGIAMLLLVQCTTTYLAAQGTGEEFSDAEWENVLPEMPDESSEESSDDEWANVPQRDIEREVSQAQPISSDEFIPTQYARTGIQLGQRILDTARGSALSAAQGVGNVFGDLFGRGAQQIDRLRAQRKYAEEHEQLRQQRQAVHGARSSARRRINQNIEDWISNIFEKARHNIARYNIGQSRFPERYAYDRAQLLREHYERDTRNIVTEAIEKEITDTNYDNNAIEAAVALAQSALQDYFQSKESTINAEIINHLLPPPHSDDPPSYEESLLDDTLPAYDQ